MRPVLPFLIGIVAGLAALFLLLNHQFGVWNLVSRAGDGRAPVLWADRGPTPEGEKRFTPQGATWVDGKLIFSNCWKDTKSVVYEIDPHTMGVLRSFDMPPEAVHTSGLGWDGTHLWAVDYESNRAYAIELEASLAASAVQVVGSFDTTLRGTSACCVMPWDGEPVLAISDFMRTRRTILVRARDALADGTAEGHVVFDYENEGFSQGLLFAEGHLYEANNKWGVDAITKMDLTRLRETRVGRRAAVATYDAPSKSIEDLAWDGTHLWTSDEYVFRFFRGQLDAD